MGYQKIGDEAVFTCRRVWMSSFFSGCKEAILMITMELMKSTHGIIPDMRQCSWPMASPAKMEISIQKRVFTVSSHDWRQDRGCDSEKRPRSLTDPADSGRKIRKIRDLHWFLIPHLPILKIDSTINLNRWAYAIQS